jgi:hypothetical protein
MTFRKQALVVSVALLGGGLGQSVDARDSGDWQYEITPYLFAAGLDGTTGVRGVETDLDLSFDDILSDLEGAFMGVFTAQKGPWSYGLEGLYVKLEDQGSKSVTGPFGNVSVSGALQVATEQYIYQGSVGYRLIDDRAKVDLIGALRYTKIKLDVTAEITTTPAIVFPGGTRSAKGDEDWLDAVVGARVLYPLSPQWSLLGYADVGGGGSDLTYQFMGGVNWEFKDGYTAKVGYRLLDWDYENGGNVWDMTESGAYLGLGIRF